MMINDGMTSKCMSHLIMKCPKKFQCIDTLL